MSAGLASVSSLPPPGPPSVEPPLSVANRARLKRVCDMLIDSEDELIYVVRDDPTLQGELDTVVSTLMVLTKRVNE